MIELKIAIGIIAGLFGYRLITYLATRRRREIAFILVIAFGIVALLLHSVFFSYASESLIGIITIAFFSYFVGPPILDLLKFVFQKIVKSGGAPKRATG